MGRSSDFQLQRLLDGMTANNGAPDLVLQTMPLIQSPGRSPVTHKFGRRTVANDSDPEDITAIAADLYPFPVAPVEDMQYVSGSAQDDEGGSGVQVVRAWGLDENWKHQTEYVVMNGQTPVLSAYKWMRLYRLRGGAVGSGGVNAGAITAASLGSATVYANMAAGAGTSRQCVYSIADGYYGNLITYIGSMAGNTNFNVELSIFVRHFGESWYEIHADEININKDFLPAPNFTGHYLPSKSDIRMTKLSTSGAASVKAELHIAEYPVGS